MSGLKGGERVETTTYAASGEVISTKIEYKPTRCSICDRVLETSEDWSRCKSDHTIQRLQKTPEGRRTLQMRIDQREIKLLTAKQRATNSPSMPPMRPVVPQRAKLTYR